MADKKQSYKSSFDEILAVPPAWALKTIQAGRLKGKSDINPQWRIEAMTQKYGTCGIGWYYKNIKHTFQEGSAGEIFVFAEVEVYIKNGEEWSMPIPGTGGSMIVQREKNGLYNQDEGVKMAYTDALSVALKFLGVASAVYAGQIEGIQAEQTKYTAQQDKPTILHPDCITEIMDCKTLPELQIAVNKWAKTENVDLLKKLAGKIKLKITAAAQPTIAQVVGDDLPDNLK